MNPLLTVVALVGGVVALTVLFVVALAVLIVRNVLTSCMEDSHDQDDRDRTV